MSIQDETHRHHGIQRRWTQAFMFVTALLLPVSAHAIPVFNGSFEQGLLGWNTYGDVSVQGSSFGFDPTDESGFALLTTIDANEPVAYGTSFSGVFADPKVPSTIGLVNKGWQELYNALAGQYTHNAHPSFFPHGGSALQQTVYADAGQKISFDYNFLTNDGGPSNHVDFALVTITGTQAPGTQILSPLDDHLLNASNANLNTNPYFHTWESGFQNFSYFALSSGYYTVEVGVFDTYDSTVMSAIALDNFKVMDIPEPSSAGLIAVGLLGLGALRRRRPTRG